MFVDQRRTDVRPNGSRDEEERRDRENRFAHGGKLTHRSDIGTMP
jgi:hypothetical protein